MGRRDREGRARGGYSWRIGDLAEGALGDALNTIGAAAGYNLRWLMRQIAFLRAWLQSIIRLTVVERSGIVGAVVR